MHEFRGTLLSCKHFRKKKKLYNWSLKYYYFIITSIFLFLKQSKKEQVILNLIYEVANFKDVIHMCWKQNCFTISLSICSILPVPRKNSSASSCVCVCVCTHAHFKSIGRKRNKVASNLKNINCMFKEGHQCIKM